MIDSPQRSQAAPAGVTLDLWPIPLDPPAEVLACLRATLSPDEIERSKAFRFRRDAERFVAGRGQIRAILGRLLAADPASLRFAYGKSGKPQIDGHPGLGFNLAHSATIGLLAVAGEAEVGVDVESSPPPRGACEEIAPMYFAAEEVETLSALAPTQRDAAFLRCWTRKEAYVKALGDGLQVPLEDFAVSLAPGEPARLRWCRAPGESERWSLVDLSRMIPGAIAAACVAGRVSAVRQHRGVSW